jgi:hypothetical protein
MIAVIGVPGMGTRYTGINGMKIIGFFTNS